MSAFSDFVGQWLALAAQRDAIHWQATQAEQYADAENWWSAIYMLGTAIRNCASMTVQIFDADAISWDYSFFNESLYWAAQDGEAAEIDMSAILEALWDASPEQCLLFIPMIDSMRGSIQNKTVTSDWMSQALRHFM